MYPEIFNPPRKLESHKSFSFDDMNKVGLVCSVQEKIFFEVQEMEGNSFAYLEGSFHEFPG